MKLIDKLAEEAANKIMRVIGMDRDIDPNAGDLKPCPFCNGTDLKLGHTTSYFVICKECGCIGRTAQKEEDAYSSWNYRV